MNSIFARNLLDKKISTMVWSVALMIFAMIFAALFETVSGEISGFVDSLPDSFSAFVGDLSAGTTPNGWLAIELYGLFLPIILAVVGSNAGANTIGKEEDSGTLELILASPISRSRVIYQKALAIKIQLFIIAMGAWAGAAIGSMLFNFDPNLVNVFWASVSGWLLGICYSYTSLAAQAVTGKRFLALGVGSGLIAVTYFAKIVSELVNSLEFLKYISPFYYFNVQDVLTVGPDFSLMSVLVLIALAMYITAHLRFIRRDTGV